MTDLLTFAPNTMHPFSLSIKYRFLTIEVTIKVKSKVSASTVFVETGIFTVNVGENKRDLRCCLLNKECLLNMGSAYTGLT